MTPHRLDGVPFFDPANNNKNQTVEDEIRETLQQLREKIEQMASFTINPALALHIQILYAQLANFEQKYPDLVAKLKKEILGGS